MGLQTGLGDSHEKCGGDVFKQTVQYTSSGDRKTVDSGCMRLTISDEDEPYESPRQIGYTSCTTAV